MTARALGLADAAAENALLVGIIEAISAGPELEVLAAKVAPLIVAATDTDACCVHVLDDTERSLTLVGATPPLDRQVGEVHLHLGEGVTGKAASRQEPVVATAEAGHGHSTMPLGEEHSCLAVPMTTAPGGLVGVLTVYTRTRRVFTDDDIRLLTTIGRLLAGAVHQARLHRRLLARERAYERFTEQAIAAQEVERRRLAADIHDGITQRLCSLRFHLDAASDALTEDPPFASRQLALARELADLTLDEARAAITNLRPPVLDDLGLADSLASLARSIPGVTVLVDVEECLLPEHVEIALYRIAQEALQNVVKHADATRVRVHLRRDPSEVLLEVSDDGRGIDDGVPATVEDRSPGGYGMTSMTERAELIGGRLDVRSRPGIGTTVTARIPVS
ncbi:GAF domain-containing sensor histidine kinase [Thermasporomyces composti]|uniref:Oxygen sensor histidine kinase NreB n=1 Tax=Thermasporomyces composti TaxID=696763 RepID=A0A3D9V300_THECX|nr:GAF domain-containing sensor histidine kinase [Thermasporomyces composti]REF36182.1 signal transduction histidine kinase [Thermasporomyces composti]